MGLPFRVNSYQDNWQREPVILTQADGGFLILWESYLNNYDDGPAATYIAGQFFDAAGNKVGSEMVVAGSDMTSHTNSQITRLPDGGFVLTWVYDDYDDIFTLDTEIWASVYNADGSIRQQQFRVDSVASNNAVRPVVTATGDGGFVISWGIDSSETNFDQIYARAYTAQGVAKGPNFLVNTVVQDFDQIVSRSATLADGRAVIIWKSEATIDNSGAGQSDIRASILNPDGSVLRADFQLSPSRGHAGTAYNFGYDIVGLSNGGFAVVDEIWSHQLFENTDAGDTLIVMNFFDRNGNAVARNRIIHATDEVLSDTRVTQLASGEIVVVWSQHSETPGEIGNDTYGRILSSSGQLLSPIFVIGTDIDNYTEQDDIEIEALVGGGFVVSYTDGGIDNDNDGVAAQIFGRGTNGNDVMAVDVTGRIAGLGGNDVLTGNARANLIDGGAGNDRLLGSGGNDSLLGGFGNDTLLGGAGNDQLIGGAGSDMVTFATNAAIRVNLGLSSVQDTGEGRDQLTGVEHVSTGGGHDVLIGSALGNSLASNGGNDRLLGGRGNDTLSGGAGRDSLDGGDGHDVLAGGLGIDTAIYAGNVRVTVSLAKTTGQVTGLGTDRLSGIENLTGGNSHDRLTGNAGGNVLNGGAGNDALFGGAGNDLLIGGQGSDRLIGGAGADTFVFDRLGLRDRVFDFEDGIDKLRIDVANPNAPGISITGASGGTLIAWHGSSVLLDDITPGQITADDLIFV